MINIRIHSKTTHRNKLFHLLGPSISVQGCCLTEVKRTSLEKFYHFLLSLTSKINSFYSIKHNLFLMTFPELLTQMTAFIHKVN